MLTASRAQSHGTHLGGGRKGGNVRGRNVKGGKEGGKEGERERDMSNVIRING